MTTLMVDHKVRDYVAWKQEFDNQQGMRKQHGCVNHVVFRALDDSNDVLVVMDFPSADAAQSFLNDPNLNLPEAWERAALIEVNQMMHEKVEQMSY